MWFAGYAANSQGSNFLNVKWLNVQSKDEKSAYQTHAERDSLFHQNTLHWNGETNQQIS